MEKTKLKLNSHQLRKSRVGESQRKMKRLTRNPLVLVLDNVLDTYNIGSFFRLGDALAVQKICLCGPVVTPPNIKIHRSSIGTWKWIPWQHYESTLDCIRQLKKEGYQIIAAEQNEKSINYKQVDYTFPLALIAGSESKGISQEILKEVDRVVEIPMYGVNISLNVLIAVSIIAFEAVSKLNSTGSFHPK